MKIGMVGTGYVGLVTGTCLANSGDEVICLDIDARKVQCLLEGRVPIHEPGLDELIQRNSQAGRLGFTTDMEKAIEGAQCIFIAVGTPQAEDGAADLRNLWQVVERLAAILREEQIVVIKSTVPVGTNAAVARRLYELTGRHCRVASNPEFLKEGTAIHDFTFPDRVVVGIRDDADAECLRSIYAPFLRTDRPFLVMSPESAELTKYVANAFLATKISFINEIATLCEHTGANINQVRRGIGHDTRIGFSFLFPGAGYGGSCFPKDVRALKAVCKAVGVEPRIIDATDRVNETQKSRLFDKIFSHFQGRLRGLTLAVWGLAFKPGTDDIREAPSLVLIDRLLERGARLQVHDPVAMPNVKRIYGDRLTYCDKPFMALREADGLVIVTEWNEFRNPDLVMMRQLLKQPVVFDGRNLYEEPALTKLGFVYRYMGQPGGAPTKQPSQKRTAA
jgi:UDPglucose 6-dehydrogenase